MANRNLQTVTSFLPDAIKSRDRSGIRMNPDGHFPIRRKFRCKPSSVSTRKKWYFLFLHPGVLFSIDLITDLDIGASLPRATNGRFAAVVSGPSVPGWPESTHWRRDVTLGNMHGRFTAPTVLEFVRSSFSSASAANLIDRVSGVCVVH